MAHPCSDLLLFVMHLMLKRGADPNAANEHGLTALHNACLRAAEGNVLFLLQNGADVNAADKYVARTQKEGFFPVYLCTAPFRAFIPAEICFICQLEMFVLAGSVNTHCTSLVARAKSALRNY